MLSLFCDKKVNDNSLLVENLKTLILTYPYLLLFEVTSFSCL